VKKLAVREAHPGDRISTWAGGAETEGEQELIERDNTSFVRIEHFEHVIHGLFRSLFPKPEQSRGEVRLRRLGVKSKD
jgi:hypothetical protein